ncbi:8701_t:CDS:1, partial [Scutellospora calospora]
KTSVGAKLISFLRLVIVYYQLANLNAAAAPPIRTLESRSG